MKSLVAVLATLFILCVLSSPNTEASNLKEDALYKAKAHITDKILVVSDQAVRFAAYPLAAKEELFTVVFTCEAQQKQGLVFGFSELRWNDEGSGRTYESFAFKSYTAEDAIKLLSDVQQVIEENRRYLKEDPDNYNITMRYDDVTFIVYFSKLISDRPLMRVFWNGYDAQWSSATLDKTLKKMQKKL